jgi:hypothetical protein
MSELELVLSLVSEEYLDEVIRHLSPTTCQAIVAGEGEAHAQEIAEAVWHILEEAGPKQEKEKQL